MADPRAPLDRDTLARIVRAIAQAYTAGASGGRIIFGKRGHDHLFIREHAEAIPVTRRDGGPPEAA